MNLSECLTKLSYGEFSNLALGSNGNGDIAPEKIPSVVMHINEALLRIHTRMVLKENYVYVEQRENTTMYNLTYKHAATNMDPSNTADRYLIDTEARPFTEDVIRILQVTDSFGRNLPLNNKGKFWSVFTPKFNQLQVPNPLGAQVISVHYQAKHATLDYADNREAEIEIPDTLEAALLSYVAYKVYSNMNTPEAVNNAANHLGNYEKLLSEIAEMDAANMSYVDSSTLFEEKGFV